MSERPDSPHTAASTTERTRRPRARRIGVVTSTKPDKTIRVEVPYLTRHVKYGKYMRRRTILHAHDEKNEAREGDRVEVMACRPMSRTKHWRLMRILEKRPGESSAARTESGA
jgi:small subunit ribosomal protein S17